MYWLIWPGTYTYTLGFRARVTRPAEACGWFISRSKNMVYDAKSSVRWAVAAALAASMVPCAARASTWTGAVSNSWSTSATGNWTGGVPQAAGDVADVTADIGATTTITVDSAIKVGTLNIGDSTSPYAAYVISPGSGTLTFQSSSGSAVLKQNAPGNSNSTVGAFILASNLDITDASTAQFTLNGAISGTGNITVTSSNKGRVYLSAPAGGSSYIGNLTIDGGSVLSGSVGDAVFGNTSIATGYRTITVNNNATLQLNGNLGLSANRKLVSGTGGSIINMNSKTLTVGTADQLSGSTTMAIGSASASIFTVNSTNSNFTGTLSLGTANGLTGGANTLNLNAATAINGNVTIAGTSSAVVGAAGSLGNSSVVSISNTTAAFNTSAQAGYTETAGQTVKGVGTWTVASTGTTHLAGITSIGNSHNSGGAASTLTITGGSISLEGETQFDLFTAAGSADLLSAPSVGYGGFLRVANPTSIALADGEAWQLFNGTRVGTTTFNNTFAYNDPNLPTLTSSQKWVFDYGTGTLSITAVPEPASAATLLAIGGLSVLSRRRRSAVRA